MVLVKSFKAKLKEEKLWNEKSKSVYKKLKAGKSWHVAVSTVRNWEKREFINIQKLAQGINKAWKVSSNIAPVRFSLTFNFCSFLK